MIDKNKIYYKHNSFAEFRSRDSQDLETFLNKINEILNDNNNLSSLNQNQLSIISNINYFSYSCLK